MSMTNSQQQLRKVKSDMRMQSSYHNQVQQGSSKDLFHKNDAKGKSRALEQPSARPTKQRSFSLFSRKASKNHLKEAAPGLPDNQVLGQGNNVPQLPDLSLGDENLSSFLTRKRSASTSSAKKWNIGLGLPPLDKSHSKKISVSNTNEFVPLNSQLTRRRSLSVTSNRRLSMQRSFSASSASPSSSTHFVPASPPIQEDLLPYQFPQNPGTLFPVSNSGRSSRASSILSAVNPFKAGPSLSRRQSTADFKAESAQETLVDPALSAGIDSAARLRSASASSEATPSSSFFGRRRASSGLNHLLALASPTLSSERLCLPEDMKRSASSSSGTDTDQPSELFSNSLQGTPVSSRKPSLIFSLRKSNDTPSNVASPLLAPPEMPKIPDVEEDETPSGYCSRLKQLVAESEIARILSTGGDSFHLEALKLYLSSFDFAEAPIDIALRVLLMKVHLPKETQQIDRLMEAFARRYHAQNPVFPSSDCAYILAFSMVMLQTDAFSKHNKNKMSKADYVKNTKVEGASEAILEYLYDNITAQAFQYVQYEEDIALRIADGLDSSSSFPVPAKVDLYRAIMEGQVKRLRANVEQLIPFKNPYSYSGTEPFLNTSDLYETFACPHTLAILPSSTPTSSKDSNASPRQIDTYKIGTLLVKQDLKDGGKRISSRRWLQRSVILTKSQLLLFRDGTVADNLKQQLETIPGSRAEVSSAILSRLEYRLSLATYCAVYDFSFTKKPNAFSLMSTDGSHFLLQAQDVCEMNEWISLINYAAAFKSSNIFMRHHVNDQGLPLPPLLSPSCAEGGPDKSSVTTVESTESILPEIQKRQILSTQGQVVGHKHFIHDPSWSDDNVFEAFSHNLSQRQRQTSRSRVLTLKINELDAEIMMHKADLQIAIGRARSFALCRPAISSTRDRIRKLSAPLAKEIQRLRLLLCRKTVAREVLAVDMVIAEREAKRAKSENTARIRLKSTASEMNLPMAVQNCSPDMCRPSSTAMRRSQTDDANLLAIHSTPRMRTVSSPCASPADATEFELLNLK